MRGVVRVWVVKVLFLLLATSIEAAINTNGLVLHLCADAVEQSNGHVTKLLDQSECDTDVPYNSTSGDAYGAMLNTDSLNSYNTLTITNRGFRLGSTLATNLNVTTNGLTLFLVASAPHGATQRILRKQGGSVNDSGYCILTESGGLRTWASQNSSNRRSQVYSTDAEDFFVLEMVINVQNSTLSTYYDGESFTTDTSAGTLSSLSNAQNFDIGDGLDGMRFVELAIYNRVLSGEEWAEVGSQLSLKYGITEVETVSAVDNGDLEDARFWQAEWAEDASGGLSDTNLENVIYADCYVGSGDFRVEATLAIDSLQDNSDAGFVMNEYNVFGFSGEQGRMFIKGRMWGRQLLSTVATNLIEECEEFDFVLERKGDRLNVSIEGISVYETDFPWRWGGELGFRSLRVVDFSVTGHMLSMEQYLYNSPTYGRDNDLIEIAPVVLPEGPALVDNNWHLGWPIATKAANALVVAYQRAQHHHGSSRLEYGSASAAVVVRSVDGGQNWSTPFDLETVIQTPSTNNPGGMRAIGTSSEGTVVLIGRKGAFRSEDNGATWTHYPNAFEEFSEEGIVGYNLGPKIIETADGRLLAFAHVALSGGLWADWVLCWESEDDGCSWTHFDWPVPEDYHPVEPAAFLMNDTLYMLGRYHDYEKAFDPVDGLYSMVQLTMPIDGSSYPTKAQISNIYSTYAFDVLTQLAPPGKDTALGTFWSQDAADIAYNPITARIEAVVVNRTGGGSGQERDITKQTLNLWSIGPGEYRAGNVPWRFDATLLERDTMDVTKMIDGMHPGAAVIDTTVGVQHIFVYLGYYHGPAGLFRVTRPLDTSSVTNWWNSVKEEKSSGDMTTNRAYFSSLGKAMVSSSATPQVVTNGLILRLDGDNADEESGRVTAWNDLSGGGFTLQVPSGATGPVLFEQALNGHSILQFEQSSSTELALSASLASAFNPGANGDMTFLIVCSPYTYGEEEGEAWQRIINKGNIAWSGHEGYSINAAFFPGGYGQWITRAATSDEENDNKDAMVTHIPKNVSNMGFSVYTAVLHAGEGLEGYLDDYSYLTGDGACPLGPQALFDGTIAPPEDLCIGTDLNGEIAEILIYDRALTLTELNQVRAYLKQKYALEDFSEILKVD